MFEFCCLYNSLLQPLYTIKCSIATEHFARSGQMTSLKVEVERLREDPSHETTSNGQQLLMYQGADMEYGSYYNDLNNLLEDFNG